MATLRQKQVARAIVENAASDHPKPAGQVLQSVGYGTGLQHQPKRVLQSDGVLEELAILGFNEESAKQVVGDLLLDDTVEPRDRLKAAEMVFKVHGTFAPEKTLNAHLHAELSTSPDDVDIDTLVKQVESELKLLKTNG